MKYSIHWQKDVDGNDVDYVSWSTCDPGCCGNTRTGKLNVVFDQLHWITTAFTKSQAEAVAIE